MLCYQCEQTVRPNGCFKVGVCSKNPEIAYKQDLIVAGLKSLSVYELMAREVQVSVPEHIYEALTYYLFMTLTNTNFVPEEHERALARITSLIEEVKTAISKKTGKPVAEVSSESIFGSWNASWEKERVSISHRQAVQGKTITGMLEMIIYGLKGLSAYAYHAIHLHHSPTAVLKEIPDLLAFTAFAEDAYSSSDETKKNAYGADAILPKLLHLGTLCHETMKVLDEANTSTYGNPVPTEINWGPVEGKCILVSGHDLLDLYQLLKQTEGTGINIFTHGEMLACNAYPLLHSFPHLKGHFGGAWQEQRKEFASFPGPILMTTNCIMLPAKEYADRIWTTGPVGYPSVKKIESAHSSSSDIPVTDFSPIIEQAKLLPGFTKESIQSADPVPSFPTPVKYPPNCLSSRTITVGFARNTLTSCADAVLDAVSSKKLRRVFVIGGCDGALPGRNYYTDLARLLPSDTLIVTAACGKYRFNQLGLDKQMVPGTQLPRLLDAGQCNDVYSIVSFAVLLSERLHCTPNDLPVSIILSWYEQKAVADLLALLSLGIKNIRLGPRPPLFVTDDVFAVLNKQFGLTLTTTAQDDLKSILPE